MKKLRIAFVIGTFPTISENFVLNQIIYLIDQGHDIEVLAFQKGDRNTIHQVISRYGLLKRTYYFKGVNPNRLKRIKDAFSLLPKVIKFGHLKNFFRAINPLLFKKEAINLTLVNSLHFFFSRNQFDIIHSHFGPTGVFIAEIKRKGFLNRSKFVNTFHGYDFHPARIEEWKLKYRILSHQADLFTYNTPFSQSILKKIFRDFTKFEELPVSLDAQLFSKKDNPKISENKVFRIIFCGRLVEVKGPHWAVETMNRIINELGERNIKLIIVGAGPLEGLIKELIEKYHLQSYIELKGALNQEAVKAEMEKADLFFLPGIEESDGRAETQGLVIQEAQAMELPVIVSDAGGMKYGLIDGVTGFVLPQKNIKAFTEKIIFLKENPEKAREMGKAGRKFVVENYDINVLGAKLENLYFSLLK